MERVTGIGGLFFRAKDPDALNAWYAEHLGAAGGPNTEEIWHQEAGPTVWSAFDTDTDYFGGREQVWMVNWSATSTQCLPSSAPTAIDSSCGNQRRRAQGPRE